MSQQEYDQAAATAASRARRNSRRSSQQIREQRVELGYHRVHRAGGRRRRRHPGAASAIASPSRTMLTTVDDNQGLEVYLQVPVQQAPQLSVGLPVRIVDDRGQDDA